MDIDDVALNYVSRNEAVFSELSKDIWEHPEQGLSEIYAAHLLSDALETAGFSIEKNIAGLRTAFMATWGSGQPIIGILEEYDALPGLSQKVFTKKEPVEQGGPGHGCGHNLLGVGSIAAAMAAKATMKKKTSKEP